MYSRAYLSLAATGVAVMALIVAIAATAGVAPVRASLGSLGEPVDLTSDAVIYGDDAGAALTFVAKGKAFFDFNGDGLRDFLVSYWTRAHHPDLRHQHLDVVFGQAEWPAESKVSDLPNRMIVEFPNEADILPSDPLYTLNTITDIDGDRKDDLVIEKQTLTVLDCPDPPCDPSRKILLSYELRFYYGKEAWAKFIKVTEDPPDLIIRQPHPPRNDTEKGRVPMPDKLNGADMNGDGQTDLLVGSCELKGPGHTNDTKGALLFYFGPFGTNNVLDLDETEPDAAIYSSNSIQVCSPQINDFDGDTMRDLLFTESELVQSQTYHNGALVPGRDTWAATADVESLVSTRFMNATPGGDVDIAVRDINGDRNRDIVGSAWLYHRPRWDEQVQCAWYSGHAFPTQVTTESCDYRFTGLWPSTATDLNGDGALDFIFPLDHRGTEPWTWYVKLGPATAGGEMNVSDDPESADHILSLAYTLDDVTWRNGNVGGTADDDILVLRPGMRHAAPNDGHITISFGPMVEPVVQPTVPPTESTPVPTTEEPPTVPPTDTEPPPSDTPTQETGWSVCLPLVRNGESL
jgi:hypothetical protein